MKSALKWLLRIPFIVFGVLSLLPALSFMENFADSRPPREIKMNLIGIGFSRYGLVLKYYSPLCFNDAGNSGRFTECATAAYSIVGPSHAGIEYDKDKNVTAILGGGRISREEAIQMISEYRSLFLKRHSGYNLPPLPRPR